MIAVDLRTEDCTPSIKVPAKDEPPGRYFDVMLRLEDRPALRTKLEIYCTKAWFEWSENEKPRRGSIAVYQRLFEIAQRLPQSGGHESVELIWGLGLARWNRPEESIDLPMIERAVEVEIADQKDAAITIRRRATGARVELHRNARLRSGRSAAMTLGIGPQEEVPSLACPDFLVADAVAPRRHRCSSETSIFNALAWMQSARRAESPQ
jgi:hypothetical protein